MIMKVFLFFLRDCPFIPSVFSDRGSIIEFITLFTFLIGNYSLIEILSICNSYSLDNLNYLTTETDLIAMLPTFTLLTDNNNSNYNPTAPPDGSNSSSDDIKEYTNNLYS